MKQKILVIHPEDKSTDFLKPIYSDIENTTITAGGVSKSEVDNLIKEHDRILMMGHGSPSGLFAVSKFSNTYGYIVDRETVPLLRNKECIFIWCNADAFCKAHDLKGLYSGMFISEVMEATFCGLFNTPQSAINESNNHFAKEFGRVSDRPLIEAFEYIKDAYGVLTETNSVAKYNHSRLYLNN